MAGCRALTVGEEGMVLTQLTTSRDRALFILMVKSGYRVSEILGLKVGDVWQNGSVVARIRVQKRRMKGGSATRDVALNEAARTSIKTYILELNTANLELPLFTSRNGDKQGNRKPISRFQAWNILKRAYTLAGLTGPGLSCHTTRKTFAKRVFEKLNHNLVATQHALGHASIMSTVRYLPQDQEQIDEAILAV